MITPPLDTPAWQRVVDAAREMGATPSALKKWRQRGVPHEWRFKLIRAGKVPLNIFDEREASAAA